MPVDCCLEVVCVDSGHDSPAAGDGDDDEDAGAEGGDGEQQEAANITTGEGAEVGSDDGGGGGGGGNSNRNNSINTSSAPTYSTPGGRASKASRTPSTAPKAQQGGRLQKLEEQGVKVATKVKGKGATTPLSA
jgi:hypothetical protein